MTLCLHDFIKFWTKSKLQKEECQSGHKYITVVLYLYFINARTTDGYFVFHVNEQDVSTASTQQTFFTSGLASKEYTGQILDSTGTVVTIHRGCTFGL